jgi:type I restriction-modification system DNA methylase subunit
MSTYHSTNDETTPIGCIEEMVSRLPTELWCRQNLTIMDPCCGNGNFFLVLYNLLLKQKKHKKKDILENILHFNDVNRDRMRIVSQIYCSGIYNLQTTMNDFLTYDTNKKFDLIVANPPYAKLMKDGKRCSKNHNLIRPFLQKSLEILKPGGFLLFITPNNWMSLADRNHIIHQLTSLQIIHLNIHTAKKWFKKIGSSFTWYIIENNPFYKDMVVEGIWKKKEYSNAVASRTRNFIPLFLTPIVDTILQKTLLN